MLQTCSVLKSRLENDNESTCKFVKFLNWNKSNFDKLLDIFISGGIISVIFSQLFQPYCIKLKLFRFSEQKLSLLIHSKYLFQVLLSICILWHIWVIDKKNSGQEFELQYNSERYFCYRISGKNSELPKHLNFLEIINSKNL